ncbi:hypothetical protein P879_06366 [Paragonimus westermani]|uniref:Uncharacterized protein n=1 Tax=Paragonimus westermani TaxID=34504 RepID=A0A8T0DR21_9TREM|nr:hypothetical protein P879_06366 [Paragonimus westermani]
MHGFFGEKHICLRSASPRTPQLRGLPKPHEFGIPLQPILLMPNFLHHKLANWLNELLQPAKEAMDTNFIEDIFKLIEELKDLSLHNEYMCSLDTITLHKGSCTRDGGFYFMTQ